ncbi:urease accessory protein UreD [Actinobaculum suis]|uniref:urease accessory protein UreD n=1 Tax=Actinobaculum suis TaxID=1657 RepID=UPI0008086C3C|nr:urease accessory protein UreD [Actinobaculum suis]OCA93678.1 urease accessory protein UreD [Actinobaculum suis]OCA94205.1 urease accessory protein UreD [Actinobaculum suis]
MENLEKHFRQVGSEPETGVLELDIGLSGGRSIALDQYHHQAFKIIRPHYLDDSGQVYYTIANPGGGYLGGDSYRIDINVQPGASALVTDQSAAKVYRTPGNYVVQNINFSVEAGGVLEYIPDQLILYREADFRQSLVARVSSEGSLFISDVVTPGWAPDGSQFGYNQARLRNIIYVDDEPVVLDNIVIRPDDPGFAKELDFYMDGRTHFSTAICCDPGIDEDLFTLVQNEVKEYSSRFTDLNAAVTKLDKPGFMLRGLGSRTEHLLELTMLVANIVRAELRGQGKLHLRKY